MTRGRPGAVAGVLTLIAVATLTLGVPAAPAAVAAPTPNPAPTATWRSVNAAGGTTCGIDDNRHLYCWGASDAAQTAAEDNHDQSTPLRVGGSWTWASVRTSDYTTCAVRTDHEAYCWGSDGVGNTGGGTHIGFVTKPRRVASLEYWRLVVPGSEATCGITTRSRLYCWGGGGQVGDGTYDDAWAPVPVTSRSWATVAVGYSHACGITTSHELYCWSDGIYGQMGTGDRDDRLVPTRIGTESWQSVWTQGDTTCGITSDGVTTCWGLNTYQQAGVGDMPFQMSPVSVTGAAPGQFFAVRPGHLATCALAVDRRAWCWGYAGYGQFGNGGRVDSPVPVPGPSNATWSGLSVADSHACGLTTTRRLYCWGDNSHGQLGVKRLGGTALRPVRVGDTHAVLEPTTTRE